jgi:hypothetical protein
MEEAVVVLVGDARRRAAGLGTAGRLLDATPGLLHAAGGVVVVLVVMPKAGGGGGCDEAREQGDGGDDGGTDTEHGEISGEKQEKGHDPTMASPRPLSKFPHEAPAEKPP